MICRYDQGTHCFDEETCKVSGVCQYPVYQGKRTRSAPADPAPAAPKCNCVVGVHMRDTSSTGAVENCPVHGAPAGWEPSVKMAENHLIALADKSGYVRVSDALEAIHQLASALARARETAPAEPRELPRDTLLWEVLRAIPYSLWSIYLTTEQQAAVWAALAPAPAASDERDCESLPIAKAIDKKEKI